MATSQVFFFQSLGATVFLAIAETVLTSSLRSSLRHDAPNADVEAIINAGGLGIRSIVPKAQLPGVIKAYNHAIVATFVSFAVSSTYLTDFIFSI